MEITVIRRYHNHTSTLPHDVISPYGSIPIILLNLSTLTLASDLVNRSAGISSVETNRGVITPDVSSFHDVQDSLRQIWLTDCLS
jgi:hypothetical protein